LDFFHKIINTIIGDIVIGEIVPSASQGENSHLTLRFEIITKDINASEYFFNYAAGFYEGLLRKKFGRIVKEKFNEDIYLDVLQIQEEKRVGYFSLSVHN